MSRVPSVAPACALTACLVFATAHAQTGRITSNPSEDHQVDRFGELTGRVVAPDGRPIAEARVELRLDQAAEPSRTALTDASGWWRVGALRGTLWQLEIAAAGFRTARGKVDFRSRRVLPVEVTLEIDADGVVHAWLEEANDLQAGGDPAAAQRLYELALTVVPLPQSPPVHRALARVHYLQGRHDEATRSLQRALLTTPSDAEARLLLPGVMAAAGREGEAERWLGLLDDQGVAVAGGAAFGIEVSERDLGSRPTGRFRARIERASSAGKADRLLAALGSWERLGVEETAPWSPSLEDFEIYVPEASDPEQVFGLFVWISPTPRGGLPDPEMTAVLDAQSMIWIGANRSGNSRPRADRMRLALDAAAAIKAAYTVDSERVYVGGYSGGGRMASVMALHFADVFTGGVYFMGVDFYRHVAKSDQPGTLWGAVLEPPTDASRALLERRSRFVFITGSHDFNRAQTHAYRDAYVADGLTRTTLIEIPDVGHYYGFRAAELATAVEALDSGLPGAGGDRPQG